MLHTVCMKHPYPILGTRSKLKPHKLPLRVYIYPPTTCCTRSIYIMPSPAPNPAHILNLGAAFSASRVLLSAVELDLFSLLQTPHTAEQLRMSFDLHERCIPDFPDTLVALGMLQRNGEGAAALYSDTPDANFFLVKSSSAYMGGLLEFCASTLYPMWGELTEALRTGKPRFDVLKKSVTTSDSMWNAYLGGESSGHFMNAMVGLHTPAHRALAQHFDFEGCETLLDVGGGSAQCCCEVAKQNAHVTCINFDLPAVEQLAVENVRRQGLQERVRVQSGDFWNDEFDRADVIVMSHVLHDYGHDQKQLLMKKAFDALPSGGRLVVVELLIDDERKENVPGLIMSLNMLVSTFSGKNFSAQDFDEMAKKAGFKMTWTLKLVPPMDAVVALK